MSVYLGIVVAQPIINKNRFAEAINEVKHFVQAYENELTIDNSNKGLITIKPKFGGVEASFPTSSSYFHTNYYRISGDLKPSDDVKSFAYVVWECLCIFKENFPSKVELFQENLDCCAAYIKNFSQDEILRRQISCINSKKFSNEMIKQDEVDDIFYIVDLSYKKRNLKGVYMGLEILNSTGLCPGQYLSSLTETQIKLIEAIAISKNLYETELDYDDKGFHDIEMVKTLASSLLLRITKAKRSEPAANANTSGFMRSDMLASRTFLSSLNQTFERPSSMKTCLFQLSQTNDINRITFLLDNIINQYLDKIDQLHKSKFLRILEDIMNKYCNGDFGFENIECTKYCIFQNRMIQNLSALFSYNELIICEFSKESLNQIAQIVEEALIYIIQNISDYDKANEHEYKKFFEFSTNLFYILITNHSKSNLAELGNALDSIEDRIRSYFSSHAKSDCDLEEMDIFYNDLKNYYDSLKKLKMKTETINDMVYTNPKFKSYKVQSPLLENKDKENYYSLSNSHA